jgi:hypothetical protein
MSAPIRALTDQFCTDGVTKVTTGSGGPFSGTLTLMQHELMMGRICTGQE